MIYIYMTSSQSGQLFGVKVAAHRKLGHNHTKSQLLQPGQPIPKLSVLKQTHSKSGNYVIFLQGNNGKRTWEYIKSHSEVPCSKWSCKTFLPLLKDLGEWCVIFVGGHPIYTVHMQPALGGTWKCQVTPSFWPHNALW